MIVGHCTVCGRSVRNPGQLRGFRLDAHTCICGGALARGRSRSEGDTPVVDAVPRPAERGLKRSHRFPQSRGVVSIAVLGLLAAAALLAALAAAVTVAAYHLGQADGRGDLYATAVAMQAQLDTLAPRMESTRQACWIVRQATPRGVK